MEKGAENTSDFANSSHTCITCLVVFSRGDLQRDHYKSDWHRYNLKRKVVELPPVTAAVFQSKVLAQRQQEEETAKEVSFRCDTCYKTFQSKETYDSHCRSKKHLDALAKVKDVPKADVTPAPAKAAEPVGQPVEEVVPMQVGVGVDDEDTGWETDEEDEGEEGIPTKDCLFCSHSSADFQENLSHMSVKHGFFIPDVEYCTDVEGLLTYLGAKVGMGFVCLWCNERGRSFQTLDAVQKHMRDKGHCKVLHEGEAMLEYSDFYDYSSSYPDAGEQRQDSEMELDDAGLGALEERGWQLVLPSGATIGHRSLMRFYRQRLKPENQLQVVNKRSKLPAVLSQYRALGWTGTSGEAAKRKAKDIAVVNKIAMKHSLKVGMLANKFQPHYRRQTNF